MMAKSTQDFFELLPVPAQAQAEARAEALIAEELTLRDLRQARALTQKRMSELLGVEQENVSRLERRSDLLLSTLRGYVAAMGGSLRLVAEFPDRPPVILTNYADLNEGDAPAARRKRPSKKLLAHTG
jgi:transcriptional regulator with XRE-family HTH domain